MAQDTAADALRMLEDALDARARRQAGSSPVYQVPELWMSGSGAGKKLLVEPFGFYRDALRVAIGSTPPEREAPSGGEWSKRAVIYNMFVRTTAAFDHNGDGALNLPVNGDGFRETGTFLKAIAMLPYLKRLGANTVHLLPITAIGHDGNKGTLGSPYAIRNPYEIDENLSEPALGVGAEAEFRAFVEAAHRMGLRVVVEFVFRTAAKDSDWVKEHPEWMYWIKEEVPSRQPHHPDESQYGSPIFTHEELEQIHRDVDGQQFDHLIPPHEQYRNFFTAPPAPECVALEGGRYVGILADGTRVKIPGAFADWPPDDSQPPWGDVTYLRLYDHPDFNYIGYNTIRMYDSRLAQPRHVNTPLWDKIIGIIPHYQKEFRIDGVMIDMGHALPKELKSEMVQAARGENPDFAFWDENFAITRKSREEGYNAVFGYLWTDEHHPTKIRAFCHRCASEEFPIPFFATPENHNTPRAAARNGGVAYARWACVINAFLPGIPFLHSGYEIAERYPINTGLDFTREELKHLPSEKLPLFSEYAYNWLSTEEFTRFLARVLSVRTGYTDLVVDSRPASFHVLGGGHDHILAFARVSPESGRRVAVAGNMNFSGPAHLSLKLETSHLEVVDCLTGTAHRLEDHHLRRTLEPGQCVVCEY